MITVSGKSGRPFANCNASRGTFRRNRFCSVVSDFGTNFINAFRRVVKLSVKINGVGPILTTTFRIVSRIVIRQSCVTRVGTFGRWIRLTGRANRDIYIGYINLLIVFGFHRVITILYVTFQPFCRFAKYWYLTSFHSLTWSDRCAAANDVRYNRSEKAHMHEYAIVTRQIYRTLFHFVELTRVEHSWNTVLVTPIDSGGVHTECVTFRVYSNFDR